ncbi:hypothetical protein K8B33_05885 [Alcanivorax sp. JB21]|uniref:hypothetical protein n=1 Tax=Alcanivorax limicola TaxID=2874102 RepID=UPI001CBE60B5|nr:hypothetical protein [Alcanivorax limicola]MBZ2188615.1 hypothetical protein [Alcanivorax limicola]
MEFHKASEQNAWDAVAEATHAVRRNETAHADLLEWLQEQGVDISQAVFPCIGLFDNDVFSGTLVSQNRRVYEYFVDLSDRASGDFEDVTDQLGPKDPAHPNSDVRDLITMALVYFDNQRGQAA